MPAQITELVKDLTIEGFKEVVGQVIEEKLRELLTDPNVGLTLKPEVQARLVRGVRAPQRVAENTPAAVRARRRGLDW